MPRTPSRGSPPDLPEGPIEVDVTLIDAMLALTPEERIRENDRMLRAIEELRHGFEAGRRKGQ